MKEGLSSEHGGELFRHPLEELLDGGGVTNEGGGHLKTTWWNVTDSGFNVVWNPLNEIGAVLVLDVEHLFVNFLHGHTSTEHGRDGKVAKENNYLNFGKKTFWAKTEILVKLDQKNNFMNLTVRDVGRRRPSCSWHRTFAG